MKKLLKSADKKIIAALLVIMLLLSTVAICSIYATITNEEDSRGDPAHAVGEDGRYLTVRDLKDMYDILCCYHGGAHSHLTGSLGATLVAGGYSTTTTDSGKEIGYLLKSDEGNETALTMTSTSSTSPFSDSSYTTNSYGYYHVASTEIARPKEAYILAEMIEEIEGGTVFYDDEYSAIQYAWWTTIAGSHGTIKTPNSLSEEAEAFEAYIADVANSTDPSTFVEQHYSFEKDGVLHEGDVPAPVINYEPRYDRDTNRDGVEELDDNGRPIGKDKVTTTWDENTQTWTVGPFIIDYVERGFSAGDRPDVEFSAISNSELYTNLGKVDPEHWKFNWIEGERDTADEYPFPHENEKFYVELDYIEGATEITNLHFDFKYMNAGGKFDYLEGTYFIETWTPDSKVIETCPGPSGNETTCSHGHTSSHPIKWQYWLNLTGMEEDISQLLAYGIIGARWYQTVPLDLDEGWNTEKEHEGSFKIVKKIVDENGNELPNQDRNKKFKFEIRKDGELYDTVWVSVNKPYTSPTFTWKDGETAPSFTVKEILHTNKDGYVQYGDIGQIGELEAKTLEFTAKNYQESHEGYVSITKTQLGTGLENMEFSFKLYVDNKVYVESGKTSEDGTITLKVGETWTSNVITWKGDTAPKYKVSEINLPENSKLVNLVNDTGVLSDKKTANVIAVNEKDVDYEHATIKIEKKLDGNLDSDEKFSFRLKVGNDTFEKELKAGQSWSETFTWIKGEKAPDYSVEEINIPEGWKLVEIKNKQGTLTADAKIDVIIINDSDEDHSAKIQIHKETISDDKEGVDENNDVFTFTTRISGTFEMSGESIVNGTKTITSTLKSGQTVTLDEVKWKGDKVPTYTVSETSVPDGWKLKEITNASGELEDGKTVEVKCTNEYKIREVYDLTMEMAGKVWEDAPLNEADKNTEDSKPNGKFDAGVEEGIEKVEVVIWKKFYDDNGNELVNLRKVATGYEDGTNTVIDFPLYTSADGVWEAPRMEVPGLSDSDKEAGAVRADYDVEFTYDGQTYRPTDFLVSGNVAHFRRATNAQKSQYLNDSMAYEVEAERQAFDNKFETITGDTAIDDNGVTNGYAVGSDGTQTELLYYSTDSIPTVEGNTRKISELQTLDDGYIRDQYKMKSRTSTGGLTYPFDDKVHLENVKKEIDKIEGGLIIRYQYSATYPYLLNINLGLVRRDLAELALTKDVYSATVAVNQKLLNYKFNEYVDFESEEYKDYLNLQLKVADANIAYKLDLYESDYYYRAQVYDGNSELKGALQDFYATLNKTNLADELDLDVFLTYKLSIYNNSDSYYAKVKSVTDYFDEDLELVDTNVTKYVQEADGQVVDSETVVATPAYVVKKGVTESSMWAEQLRESIQGKVSADYSKKYTSTQDLNTELSNSAAMATSSNVKAESAKSYYKANIDLNNDSYKLAAGEKLEVYLTFKVRTDEAPARFGDSVADAVRSYVRLGTKANVAEIASYTTYYSDAVDGKSTVAGKVDKDSAPNNIDIENKNEKAWYEDDGDSAPIITLDLYNETRDVDGFAWEDKPTEKIDYNQVIGNGMYDDGERLIGNVTTEMVEKVTVKQADGTYKDYDFVWPTHQSFDFLNNQTLEQITGFDSITLTSNAPENTGAYKFTNIPAGNYVVRFEYGNFPADDLDSNGNTVKLDGVAETKTSDDNSREPAVYNGQDFKTTAYESDIINDNGKSDYASNDTGYIDNEWYDFSTAHYDENGVVTNHNSDVIDNEARRLEVIAYSRVLDNTITTILATANKYDADHTELYKNTSMFADTAKINLNIENMNSLKGQKVVVTDELSGQTKEVLAGDTETRNNLLTNTVIGKSDVNGEKGTVTVINYNYKIEAIDAGFEERSNTEFVLDKEIESITLTTNSGEQILKAVYNIDYTFDIDDATGTSTYTAKVELNKDESYGTENLMAQNKDEDAGLQNFRYIYYDDTISQSLNLEIVYRFSVLNIGEVDRTGKVATLATADEILAKANELKDQTYRKEGNKLVSVAHPLVGEYVGSIYYIGKRGSYSQPDVLVTTKARQLIDYVDNDAVFKAADNTGINSSWKSVTADELLADKVINASIIEEVDGANTILDDKGVAYTTTQRNNLVLSVDGVLGDKLANPGFIVELVPYAASKENSDTTNTSCQAAVKMVMTRSIDSQIDEDDLSYDNIAELVKLENTVGKRDIKTVAGNVDPKGGLLGDGEFAASLDERDASATELITFTPPTGLDTRTSLTTEMLIVGIAALAILGTGIVLIKKYVIK